MMIMSWMRRLMPEKQSDDPVIAEITQRIDHEKEQLAKATNILSKNVSALAREKVEMSRLFDEALQVLKGPGRIK